MYRDSATQGALSFTACPPATTGITATFVNCGFGATSDFPASVRNKIALVSRSNNIGFFDQAQNAFKAGAMAIVVYDNAPFNPANPTFPGFFISATSADAIPATAPFLGILQADGQALLATPNATISFGNGFELFMLDTGTSMACPRRRRRGTGLGGVAKLHGFQRSNGTRQTAKDLGAPGKDTIYGFGLVDALAAAKQLNSSAFAVKGRYPGRRGTLRALRSGSGNATSLASRFLVDRLLPRSARIGSVKASCC